VSPVTELRDENGSVLFATIKTFNDTVHSFVQRVDYKGPFLPGFQKHPSQEAINQIIPPSEFEFIDHIVNNQKMGDMEPTIEYYEKVLSWHRFWSVDDDVMHTDLSSLKSIVVADFDENIKMPCNEPAIGKKKSQI
jgi:4-hydroxyphenylpyruvate dioxygenase